jgi:hypothetical protein
VVPGTFTVSMAGLKDGKFFPLGQRQRFEVQTLGLAKLAEEDRAALLAFQRRVGELQRAALGAGSAIREALRRIQFMKQALLDTPGADPDLRERLSSLERRLQDLQVPLYGDRIRERLSEPAPPSILNRLDAQLGSTGPVTETHRRGYEIAAEAFETWLPDLRRTLEVELRGLEEALEAAGAPWTPGRPLPVWKKK